MQTGLVLPQTVLQHAAGCGIGKSVPRPSQVLVSQPALGKECSCLLRHAQRTRRTAWPCGATSSQASVPSDVHETVDVVPSEQPAYANSPAVQSPEEAGLAPDSSSAEAGSSGAAEEAAAEDPAHVQSKYKKVLELQAAGKPWKGRIASVNRGGVVLNVRGLRGFIPYSRLDPARVPPNASSLEPEALQHLVGQEIAAIIIQTDLVKRRALLSERAVAIDKACRSYKVGDIVEGRVERFTDYGAFVSIKDKKDGSYHGVEGLVHLSEMSWDRVMTPESVLSVGQEVRAKVTRLEADKRRMGLSIKRLEEDPLMETLDKVMPLSGGGEAGPGPEGGAEGDLPQGVAAMIAELEKEEGVAAVSLGRRREEKRAVSQDLELWISKESVEDGFNLVARAGRSCQEIHVRTSMTADAMKQAVQNVMKRVV